MFRAPPIAAYTSATVFLFMLRILSDAFILVFGLAFGSFLNVCISRLPKGESVVRPRSHCPRCGQKISSLDNLPLLSWLLLGRRCRACGERISWIYPAVELITSVLFLICWMRFGPTPLAGGWATLCFLLIGLAVMDARTMLLPDLFTIPGIFLGVLFAAIRAAVAGDSLDIPAGLVAGGRAIVAAAVAAGFLALILGVYWMVRKRQGVGAGDIKLIAMLAAWLGLSQTVLVFFLAVIFGTAYGLFVISRKRSAEYDSVGQLAIPFGAFLSAAGLYSIFLGQGTVAWYCQFFR